VALPWPSRPRAPARPRALPWSNPYAPLPQALDPSASLALAEERWHAIHHRLIYEWEGGSWADDDNDMAAAVARGNARGPRPSTSRPAAPRGWDRLAPLCLDGLLPPTSPPPRVVIVGAVRRHVPPAPEPWHVSVPALCRLAARLVAGPSGAAGPVDVPRLAWCRLAHARLAALRRARAQAVAARLGRLRAEAGGKVKGGRGGRRAPLGLDGDVIGGFEVEVFAACLSGRGRALWNLYAGPARPGGAGGEGGGRWMTTSAALRLLEDAGMTGPPSGTLFARRDHETATGAAAAAAAAAAVSLGADGANGVVGDSGGGDGNSDGGGDGDAGPTRPSVPAAAAALRRFAADLAPVVLPAPPPGADDLAPFPPLAPPFLPPSAAHEVAAWGVRLRAAAATTGDPVVAAQARAGGDGMGYLEFLCMLGLFAWRAGLEGGGLTAAPVLGEGGQPAAAAAYDPSRAATVDDCLFHLRPLQHRLLTDPALTHLTSHAWCGPSSGAPGHPFAGGSAEGGRGDLERLALLRAAARLPGAGEADAHKRLALTRSGRNRPRTDPVPASATIRRPEPGRAAAVAAAPPTAEGSKSPPGGTTAASRPRSSIATVRAARLPPALSPGGALHAAAVEALVVTRPPHAPAPPPPGRLGPLGLPLRPVLAVLIGSGTGSDGAQPPPPPPEPAHGGRARPLGRSRAAARRAEASAAAPRPSQGGAVVPLEPPSPGPPTGPHFFVDRAFSAARGSLDVALRSSGGLRRLRVVFLRLSPPPHGVHAAVAGGADVTTSTVVGRSLHRGAFGRVARAAGWADGGAADAVFARIASDQGLASGVGLGFPAFCRAAEALMWTAGTADFDDGAKALLAATAPPARGPAEAGGGELNVDGGGAVDL